MIPQVPILPTLLIARAIVGNRADHAPGALLIRWGGDATPLGGSILAAGSPEEVRAHPDAAGAEVVEWPEHALLPAFVNAHTHLDLTHIGPRPYDDAGGFAAWGGMVLRERRRDDVGIMASVRRGVGLLLEAGVVAVGDIAGVGSTAPTEALRESSLLGVSFVGFFGLPERAEPAAEAKRALVEQESASAPHARVAMGLSPHAPYSASVRIYEEAAALQRVWGAPISTHLSECPEELEFVAECAGPLRSFLERLDLWRETLFSEFGRGERPVAHLAGVLERARILCAHLHSVTDEELALLSRTRTPVVYCPRCADYFGRADAFGPHRYREMLSAGVRVALGADSVINLPAREDGAPSALSTLDEARLLVRRDGLPARTALAMATTHGAEALGLDPALFTLDAGPCAGVVAVPVGAEMRPLDAVMATDAPPTLLRPGLAPS
ncbi:MAG: amidohydrolase family protein [Phycisphaerales bacterium]